MITKEEAQAIKEHSKFFGVDVWADTNNNP